MTQSVRQRNLFAAEDFRLQYLALSNINLRSYDFDTIRKDLVQYIQRNFPENFNDFTASSEFNSTSGSSKFPLRIFEFPCRFVST